MVFTHHLDNFNGRRTGARRQAPDLVSHHRKATAMLTGPGRFNGRIERQQVGLIGNAANGLDDLADDFRLLAHRIDTARGLVEVFGNGLDGLHRLLNHLRTFLRARVVLH